MKSSVKIAICAGAYEYFIVVYDLMAELKMPKPEHLESVASLLDQRGKRKEGFNMAFVDYDLLKDFEEQSLEQLFESLSLGVVVMFSPSDVDRCDALFALGMKDFIVKNYARTKLKNRIMEIWETVQV